jgi:hypothetical protein
MLTPSWELALAPAICQELCGLAFGRAITATHFSRHRRATLYDLEGGRGAVVRLRAVDRSNDKYSASTTNAKGKATN